MSEIVFDKEESLMKLHAELEKELFDVSHVFATLMGVKLLDQLIDLARADHTSSSQEHIMRTLNTMPDHLKKIAAFCAPRLINYHGAEAIKWN